MALQHSYLSHEKTEKPKTSNPVKKTPKNNTSLPYNLQMGIERLSGIGMDDVKVHYNSSRPAQLQALAYTQETDIHVAPGQEKYLPHEAWHVVQQKQGRVKPTMQLKDVNINDDSTLEHEADVMGAKALQLKSADGNCIQRAQLGEGSFSFMKNQRDAIERPKMYKSPDDIFYIDNYDITALKRKVAETSLQRDHIIPYKTIMKFTNKVCQTNDQAINLKRTNWFIQGVAKMEELGSQSKGKYYDVGDLSQPLSTYNKDTTNRSFNTQAINNSIQLNNFDNNNPTDRAKFEVIHKSISWMPGNIMIAPSPKLGDTHSGDDFDDTCENVIPDQNYHTLKDAYINMKNFLTNTENTVSAETALDELRQIITWDGPYAFDPQKWLLDTKTGTWKNNLKKEEDIFTEIQNTIKEGQRITTSLNSDMKQIDHLTKQQYDQLKTKTAKSILELQHCILVLQEFSQEYCNLRFPLNIEKTVQHWQMLCGNIEKNFERVAVKYNKQG